MRGVRDGVWGTVELAGENMAGCVSSVRRWIGSRRISDGIVHGEEKMATHMLGLGFFLF